MAWLWLSTQLKKVPLYTKFHFRKLAGHCASLHPPQSRPAASPYLSSLELEPIEFWQH